MQDGDRQDHRRRHDPNVDHATQEFEAIANTYKFGDLTPRLRQFTNLKAWQAEMDRFSVSNLGEFVQVSNLLRWVFRQELDSGGSGTGKGRFKIKFKLKHGRQFKVEITKFEYREAPGSGRRKIEMDLEVTYI